MWKKIWPEPIGPTDCPLNHNNECDPRATWFGFRKEFVEVHRSNPGGENILEGTVADVLGTGITSSLVVDVGISIVASSRGEGFSVGEHVFVRLPPESIVFWAT